MIEFHSNVIVEDLGVQEIDVYDIEVEDNHNFFANDLLVHNSVYIDFSKIVEKYFPNKTDQEIVDALDKLSKEKIEPYIQKQYEYLEDVLNVQSSRLVMARESIGPGAFFAKKRYIMRVFDSEGVRYQTPKMKVMGLESVRSTTPKFFRNMLNEAFEISLTEQSERAMQAHIQKVEEDFKLLGVEEYAKPTGVNGVNERNGDPTIKGTPAHVKAAIYYNNLVKEHGLDGSLPLIKDGDKMKWLYLKEPNPIQADGIAFVDKLPDEFGLRDYVDTDRMLQDNYLAPLDRCMKVFGWSLKPRVDLASFMDECFEPTDFTPKVEVKQARPKSESNTTGLDSFFGD